jgi:hypothetical protein
MSFKWQEGTQPMKTIPLFSFCILLATISVTAAANLVTNGGFESGDLAQDPPPDSWSTFGDGEYNWQMSGAHSGDRCMELGGTQLALMFQRVPGAAGQHYACSVWAKQSSGASASLKIEFHRGQNSKISEEFLNFNATDTWTEYSLSATAPAETVFVTPSIVANGGGTVLFDDVALVEEEETGGASELSFDLSDTAGTFQGFGAQIWGYYSNRETLQKGLGGLNIRYVRIENYAESATWTQMQRTRAVTDTLGVEWLYMAWSAPGAYRDGGMLDDPEGYGIWWAGHVDELYTHDIPVEYIELMNEPDSGGEWSTGIAPEDYNTLVKATRAALDSRGYEHVGIVGPGTSAMTWARPERYINAFDSEAAQDLFAWSCHTWDDDTYECNGEGGVCLEQNWARFAAPAEAKNSALPKWITEHSTKDFTFHGVTYPKPDEVGPYNTTNTMPYAARVYENTLSILNSGARVVYFWQLMDEPTELYNKNKGWGFLDIEGNPKPVYETMKTLCAELPAGVQVVTAPDQDDSEVYAGVFRSGNRIIVGLANDRNVENTASIRLENAPAELAILDATACVIDHAGNAAAEDPDTAQVVKRTLSLTEDGPGVYSFEAALPADSVLTVVLDITAKATVLPDDEHFQYIGRIDFEEPQAPVLSWSGSQVIARFEGTSVQARFDDTSADGNYYYAIVDDRDPVLLDLEPGNQTYTIANGLEDTTHTLELFKRTEGSTGATVFRGLYLDEGKGLVAPPPRRNLRIEFYGDSITSSLALNAPEDEQDTLYTNHFLSYAKLTADNLNAERHTISVSGIGIHTSWWPENMPDHYYNRLVTQDPEKQWDFSKWTPQVVVINLGQNDKWKGVTEAQAKEAYTDFINKLRGHYGTGVHIILCLGTMDATRSDSPWPGYVEEVVNTFNTDHGDTRVQCLMFPYDGLGTHPHAPQNVAMAELLTAFIQSLGDLSVERFHSADLDQDNQINETELLRVTQFFNQGALQCDSSSEDGYQVGAGAQDCPFHDSDYVEQDWQISLSEVLRFIQFYNADGCYFCENSGSEDGFCMAAVVK